MADPSIGAATAPPAGQPELVVVGAASRDLDAADPRGGRLGGAVSYGALTAARLGVAVGALIGADATAATALELDLLRGAGARVRLAALERGPVFENRHVGRRREQHCIETSDAISPEVLPDGWRDAGAFLLGPVADELGDEWAAAVPRTALVALAWQGLLRELVPGRPVRCRPLAATALVRRADVLLVSSEDIVAGGPPLSLLLRDGQTLIATNGDRGALRIRSARGRISARFLPPLPQRQPLDTTGAGDSFLAAYMAARMRTPHLAGTAGEWRHFAVAAAAASLSVTGVGLHGAPTLGALCRELITPRL